MSSPVSLVIKGFSVSTSSRCNPVAAEGSQPACARGSASCSGPPAGKPPATGKILPGPCDREPSCKGDLRDKRLV